jgi:UDP-N-acetylglucosamine--N-acetylmuramyl-(pentapeptide) pyrophosphoryl-undecaprenol N-acetylglucosamine transferase
VPYTGAHQHQEKNAEFFKDANACKIIKDSQLSGEKLAQEIRYYFENREEIKRLEENVKKISKPYAGNFIVKECLELIHGEN